MLNGSSRIQCLSEREEMENQGEATILVMKWSVVVFNSDSITKLYPHSSASYRGWTCYVVLRRAYSIQAMGQGPTHAS